MYIDANDAHVEGDKARLETLSIKDSNVKAYNFWYYMYGSGIGSLNVYIHQSGVDKLVWSMKGK